MPALVKEVLASLKRIPYPPPLPKASTVPRLIKSDTPITPTFVYVSVLPAGLVWLAAHAKPAKEPARMQPSSTVSGTTEKSLFILPLIPEKPLQYKKKSRKTLMSASRRANGKTRP